MKRLLLVVAALVVLLGAVLLLRTALSPSRQPVVGADAAAPLAFDSATRSGAPFIDEAAALARLAGAIRFATVSYEEPGRTEDAAFIGLREHLQRSFPRVHAALRRDIVGGRSLLFTWRGSDAELAPVVLMGHQDVVPVEPGTEGRWSAPPFAGLVRDGYIWGRGTMDDKAGVVSTLEAAELLLAQGFTPRRTVYLAFGHDEEINGTGAALMAAFIRTKGPAPALVLDEGLPITVGQLPGLHRPVALLGTAQKGYLSLELSTRGAGGHSSTPPPHSAIGVLAAALTRLEAAPLPAQLSGPTNDMFDWAGPEMDLPLRVVMANRWLLAPLVTRLLLGSQTTAALLRTTTALTMIQGGVKDNVLPQSARAVVNLRLRPGDSVAGTTERVRRVAGEGVQVRVLGTPVSPSTPSSADSPRFALVARSLRRVDPQVVVAPSLMIGSADARHYEPMTADIYRFRPMELGSADFARVHGIDERLSVRDYERHVRFYAQVLRDVQAMP